MSILFLTRCRLCGICNFTKVGIDSTGFLKGENMEMVDLADKIETLIDSAHFALQNGRLEDAHTHLLCAEKCLTDNLGHDKPEPKPDPEHPAVGGD